MPKSVEQIIEELKAAGGTAAATAAPLGVPPGYTVKPPDYSIGVLRPEAQAEMLSRTVPHYFEGDEWTPANQPPEIVARIQRDMVDAGLFDDNDEITIGAWDATTRAAYRGLLSYANAAGLQAQDAIVRLKEVTAAGGGRVKARGGTAGGAARVSSPLEIRAVADKAAQSVIGRRLDDNESAAVVGAFQGLQSAQTASTDLPPFDVFTEDYLRRQHAGEAANMDTLGYANEFFDLLKASGG